MQMMKLLIASGAGLALAGLASANPAIERSHGFEQPLGMEYGDWERPIEPSTRDANGNRVIINGRMNLGDSTLPLGIGLSEDGFSGLGQGVAIGNQLNVITNGNNNTVIITNTQVNTGNQTATITGGRP